LIILGSRLKRKKLSLVTEGTFTCRRQREIAQYKIFRILEMSQTLNGDLTLDILSSFNLILKNSKNILKNAQILKENFYKIFAQKI